MKKLLPTCIAIGVAVLLAPDAQTAEPAKGYDAFRLVRTRNIFDPNRRPVRIETPPPRPAAPRTRSSSFTLTGTLVREGRSLAFFSGSRSEFSKVISVGDSVADYKIAAIDPSQVELEHDGKKVTLAIGHVFKIESPGGEADAPEDPTAPSEGTAAQAPTDASAPPPTGAAPNAPAGTDAKSEILRRMMERRAQEMNK